MSTPTKYDAMASDILAAVGGEGNVASVTHCATRLRFVLKDRELADKVAVEATPGVITVVEAGGQFQVVIGQTVSNVHQSVMSMTTIDPSSAPPAASGGVMGKAIDLITSIFTPFLWVLAGTGLIKALLAVATQISPEWADTPTHAILFTASDAAFQFLPMFLAVTAAKKFGANMFTSMAIAGALIYSATIAVIPGADGATMTLSEFASGGGHLDFFGIPVTMIAYLSTVIPVILAVYAQSKLELGLNRIIPETFRNFVVPMLTLVVIVPLTFLAIGPVADLAGQGLSNGVNWLWSLSPLVGGAILGAFWQVFVIFGVHWGFVPVMMQDISTLGHSVLTGPLFAAVLAQSGAAAAVWLRTRNRDLKEVSGPATVSAFLAGITEPAIYGVTLRLKKPFIFACIAGGIGGAIIAAGGVAAEGFVLPGAITVAAAMNIGTTWMLFAGVGIAIGLAFLLTLTLGFDDLPATEPTPVADAAPAAVEAKPEPQPVG